MQLSNPKIYMACSNDPIRPVLNGVYYTGDGLLWATDGHLACSEKIEIEEGDTNKPCIIQAEALKMYDKISRNKPKSIIITDTETIVNNGKATTFKHIEGTYPDILSCLPTDDESEYEICISPDVLEKLVKALDKKALHSISLKFKGKDKIIKVIPHSYSDIDMENCYFMPIRSIS